MADVLITGATGFVGGELLSALLATGADVTPRVIVRDAGKLRCAGADELDIVQGDLGDEETVRDALRGVTSAYYLVHSMEPGAGGYADRDRELAELFAGAASHAGVERIVYLGGVDPGGDGARSEHLTSRHEIERVLAGGEPELVVLRASMIVGARSDSFATLAQIVHRLPVLALPRWRSTRTQPVAIADVVAALIAAREVPAGVYDIAGPDVLTIESMCATIGDLLGDRRRTIKLPFSSAKLEGLAAAAVADSEREVLEPLLEGLHEDLVVSDNALQPVFGVEPTPFDEAARAALEQMAGAGALAR